MKIQFPNIAIVGTGVLGGMGSQLGVVLASLVLARQGGVQVARTHPARVEADAADGHVARAGQQPREANWVSHASAPYYCSGSLTPLDFDGSTA